LGRKNSLAFLFLGKTVFVQSLSQLPELLIGHSTLTPSALYSNGGFRFLPHTIEKGLSYSASDFSDY